MAKIHRFIDNFDLSKNELEITGEIAHQVIKVLKLKIGEKIELSDGKGIYAIAEIVKLGKDSVLVKKVPTPEGVGIPTASVGKNKIEVVLFCSILKKNNFELMVQKTTECGVSKIVPIISARTIKTGLNLERLQKIAKEASEQSGRATVPEILEPIEFKKAIELAEDENILFDSTGEDSFRIHCAGCRAEHSNSPAGEYVRIIKETSPIINIWVGSEGGWTPEEIKKARELGLQIKSLGKNTLRGETAAIVSTYLIKNL